MTNKLLQDNGNHLSSQHNFISQQDDMIHILRNGQNTTFNTLQANDQFVFTQHGLILPTIDTNVLDQKIAYTLDAVKAKVQEAIQAGKTIIYQPGSFNLVHAGHYSYLNQITQQYLTDNPGKTRDDIFLVILADDKKLFQIIKGEKYKKYCGEFDDPKWDMFCETTQIDKKPDCEALVAIGADCAANIPSPFASDLPHMPPLSIDLLQQQLENADIHQEAKGHCQQSLRIYQDAMQHGYTYDTNNRRPGFRGLYVANYLFGDVVNKNVVRYVSASDTNYLDEVRFYMSCCGVDVQIIQDINVLSTTQLVQTYGVQKLYDTKYSI